MRYNYFLDSYYHYRGKVGCGRFYSLYRALYYEILGCDPAKYRGRRNDGYEHR